MATFDQTEILWNKYKNLPTAFPTQTFLANQAVGDAFPTIIPTTQIWSSEIPATAPTALGSAVSITNGSYQQSTAYSWIRKYTITMGVIQAPVESYWYASTDPNDPLNTNEARDTIPFNFDPLGSYTIQVFANGTPVSPTFLGYPWNYDDAAGILTFYPINPLVLPPAPITMTYWRYVGNKGGSALSYWNITDPPPGTNLNFDYLGTTKAIINSSGALTATSVTATTFTGSLTGSATLIDTTLTTTAATHYIGFVPLVATTSTGQVLGTDGGLTYNPSTNNFEVVNGSITGTNSTISGTTITASTQFSGSGAGLTGTGSSFTSGTTNNINTVNNTSFSPLNILMTDTIGLSQVPYNNTDFTYLPTDAILTVPYIVSNAFGYRWNSVYLYNGYNDTMPSNATLNTYFYLGQMSTVSGGSNDATFTFNGVLGNYSTNNGFANLTINFKSRGGFVATGTFNSTGISLATMIANQDITVHLLAGIFYIYLVVKPNQNYYFDFVTQGISRDVFNLLQQPNTPTTATPLGTVQIASVLSQLTYRNQNGDITATSFTATTSFSGPGTNLTGTGASFTAGTANAIKNVLQTTGTQFLTFLPLSASTASQIVGTHAQVFYVVNRSQLNLGTTTGLATDSVHLAILNNTLADGTWNNIQLGYNNTNNGSYFIGTRWDSTDILNQNIFSIAPYGALQYDHFYITPVGKASAIITEGRNRLQTFDRNDATILTKYYTDSGIIYNDYNEITQTAVYTSSILGYPIPDGYTGFKIGNGANGTQIILDDIVSCKNAITNQSGFLRFWNDDFDPTGAGGSWGYMYEQNRFGINKFYTNNYQYIPLDMPILIIDSKTFLTSPCVPVSPLTQFVVPVVRAGGGNIYDITIKVSGHNPYGRTITISNQVALNFTQTSVSGATFPTATARQTYSIGSESLTKNAIPYVGYVFNSTGTGVNYLYSASAISVWNIFQPVGQLTWVITPDNTGNEIDTYVITIDFNRTENTLTGVTRAARTSNLDGSFITLVGTGIVAATSRFSGTGTLTLSTTPTNTLLTTTRSEGIGGDDGDKLRINYNNTLVSASTLQTINPVVAGTYYPLFTSSSAASGAAGITVYTNPTTSMLSINTTTSEVNINNLKVNILNLVYTRAISAQNNASELNCFTGSFTEYEVRLVITTTTPSSIYGTPLLFRFATSVGTPITTNYSGRAVFLSGTTNAFDTWSTGAYITDIQPAIPDSVYSWTVTNPNSAKRKTIKGTNNSFVSGLDSPCISTGQFTLATAYNSCAWDTTSAPGLLITGNIYIYGVH